jgi:acyl carrier protein
MNDYIQDLVRHAVAQHLGIHSSVIKPYHHFERDMALRPLDLVMIALRIEDLENFELPVEQLEWLSTVGQLTAWVRRIHARVSRERALLALRRRQRLHARRPWGRGKRAA